MAAALVRRCGTSSVSNRSVYITKFVHDQVTATNRNANQAAPAALGSSARIWLVRLTAATKTRSKNSSVHVARRSPSASSVRSVGGRTAARRSVEGCDVSSLLIVPALPQAASEITPARSQFPRASANDLKAAT